MTLSTLITSLRSGERDLLAYLAELEAQFVAREPEVLAFVPEDGRFPRLRRQAQELLARYPDPATRPPLFGLPVGVKDIFHVDGFPTHAGSQLPPELLAGPEAASVTSLRQAGALILGKTVTTEFAYFGPGPTRNPHNPAHTPGGSSSGSAAAVGAGLAPLTLGTQTIGSINRPAAYCGVVGYKPSYGRISTAGVIPLAGSYDHVGLFSPSVAGLAEVAAVMMPDWCRESADFALSTQRSALTLGIPAGPYLAHAEAEGLAHFEAVCGRLAAAGHILKRVPAMADFEQIYDRHQALMAAETAAVHADWFAAYGPRYHPKTRELIERGQAVDPATLNPAHRAQLRAELTALMDEHGLDAWVAPAAPGPAPHGLASTGNPVMSLPWTQSGLPTLNIPTGTAANGLPLGTQFIGRWWGDEHLLHHIANLSIS